MSEGNYFRCYDLMKMETLKGIKLVAGEKYLDNVVDRVNIMEVPDIADWAQSGEFLMTTGYAFQREEKAFIELIPKLKQKNIAAFGIKPNRFLGEISEEVISTAEQYGMPLFILPPATTFSNVVKEVMEKICLREIESYSVIQERIENISYKLLSDTDLVEVVESIGEMIGNPIAIADEERTLICGEKFKKLFKEVLLRIPYDAAELPQRVIFKGAEGKRYIVTTIALGKEKEFPLLFIYEGNKPTGAVDLMTIKKLIPFINMKFVNDCFNQKVKAKYRNNFLKDWINGYVKDSRELRLKADSFGIGYITDMRSRLCILSNEKEDYQNELLVRRLNEEAIKTGQFLFVEMDSVIAVLILYPSEEKPEMKKRMESIKILADKVIGKQNYRIFVGHSSKQSTHMKVEYQDCLRLMKAARVCREERDVVTWEKIGVYAILTQIPHNGDMDEFLKSFIYPVVKYEKEKSLNLVETLNIYFQSGCNIKQTADTMFTHYNTIVYRLEKIQGLLDVDFADYEARLNVEIALKLYKIYE